VTDILSVIDREDKNRDDKSGAVEATTSSGRKNISTVLTSFFPTAAGAAAKSPPLSPTTSEGPRRLTRQRSTSSSPPPTKRATEPYDAGIELIAPASERQHESSSKHRRSASADLDTVKAVTPPASAKTSKRRSSKRASTHIAVDTLTALAKALTITSPGATPPPTPSSSVSTPVTPTSTYNAQASAVWEQAPYSPSAAAQAQTALQQSGNVPLSNTVDGTESGIPTPVESDREGSSAGEGGNNVLRGGAGHSRVRVRLAISLLQLSNIPQRFVERRIFLQWSIPGDPLNSNSTRPISVRAQGNSGSATWPPFPSADTDKPQEMVLRLYLHRNAQTQQFLPQKLNLKLKQYIDPAQVQSGTRPKAIASCTINISDYAANGNDTVADFHLVGKSSGVDVTLMARVRSDWTLSTAHKKSSAGQRSMVNLQRPVSSINTKRQSHDHHRRSITFGETRASESERSVALMSPTAMTDSESLTKSADSTTFDSNKRRSSSTTASPRKRSTGRSSGEGGGWMPRVLKTIGNLMNRKDLSDSDDDLFYLYQYITQLEANLAQAQRDLSHYKALGRVGSVSSTSDEMHDMASLLAVASPRSTSPSPRSPAKPSAQSPPVSPSTAPETEQQPNDTPALLDSNNTGGGGGSGGGDDTQESAQNTTIQSLQAQVERLQARNAELEAQLNINTTAATATSTKSNESSSERLHAKTSSSSSASPSQDAAKARERKLQRKLDQEREDTKTRIAELTFLFEQQLAEKDGLIAFLQSQLGQNR
jgi:hypothetical protein